MKVTWSKHSYLTDESTELTGGETVIDASEDGNGDYNVAEESSEVIKGVDADWEKRGQKVNAVNLITDSWSKGIGALLTIEPKFLLY